MLLIKAFLSGGKNLFRLTSFLLCLNLARRHFMKVHI